MPVITLLVLVCADEEVSRPYTPISPENAIGYTTLLVKSYPTGKLSKCVASDLRGHVSLASHMCAPTQSIR